MPLQTQLLELVDLAANHSRTRPLIWHRFCLEEINFWRAVAPVVAAAAIGASSASGQLHRQEAGLLLQAKSSIRAMGW